MLLTNFYLHHLSIFLPDTNPLPLLFAPFLLFFFSIILSTFRYFPTFLSQFLHSFLLHSILYINLFFSIFPLLLHPSSPLPHSSFLPFFLSSSSFLSPHFSFSQFFLSPASSLLSPSILFYFIFFTSFSFLLPFPFLFYFFLLSLHYLHSLFFILNSSHLFLTLFSSRTSSPLLECVRWLSVQVSIRCTWLWISAEWILRFKFL